MMHSPGDAEEVEVFPVAAVAVEAFPVAAVVEAFPVAAVVEAFPVAAVVSPGVGEASRAAVRPRAAASRPVRGEHRPGPAR
jgi:hypothetical protein